jgi:hypothetical protein
VTNAFVTCRCTNDERDTKSIEQKGPFMLFCQCSVQCSGSSLSVSIQMCSLLLWIEGDSDGCSKIDDIRI